MLGVSEYEALNYLKGFGVNVVPMKLVTDLEAGLDFAQETGYPVVLKANVKDLFHKSELGVVKVNIGGPAELESEWNNILDILVKNGLK
jgi:acetyltransferase